MAEVCGLWGASRMQSPQGGFGFGWWPGEERAAISSSRLYQLSKCLQCCNQISGKTVRRVVGGLGTGRAWVCLFGWLFSSPKIDNVNLQTDIRPFCCGGGSQLCGQNVDLERRSLDSSFCCCSQISAGEFVLIILSWTEDRFEPRPNKPVAYEVSCLSSPSFL